jgi:hypothetical protein
LDIWKTAGEIAAEVKKLKDAGLLIKEDQRFPATDRGVQKLCERHGIPSREVPAKGAPGGVKRLYQVAAIPGLPVPVKNVFGVEATCKAHSAGLETALKSRLATERTKEETRLHLENCLARFNNLPENKQKSALVKQSILVSCEAFLKGGGYVGRMKDGRRTWHTKGVKEFCKQVKSGQDVLDAWVLEEIKRKGQVSLGYKTLLDWRARHDSDGLYGLTDKYVSRDSGSLTKVHRDFVEALIVDHPHISTKKIEQGIKARFAGQDIPSYWAIGRYEKKFRAENESRLLWIANPDEWRSKYQFAAGSASEDVTRLNQRWEADSTPGDIMLTDGRHTILGLIDVWSRRMRLLVSPTSKSAAVAALLRRCFLEWGKPEEYKTDNGKEYTADYLEALLKNLSIPHPLCQPFCPEQKPHIERGLQTMSHGLPELMPGYIGHSVNDRKAIEARKSFAKRLMTPGETVEVKLSSVQLQQILDRWTDAMYMHDDHEGLNGATPAEMVRSWNEPVQMIANEQALDILLLPAPEKGGWREIGKKGIRVTYGAAKLNYIATEFAGHEGESVLVKPDLTDLGRAAIFLESGEFLCWAEDPTWYGISRAEAASHLRGKQKQLMQEGSKELKAKARALKTREIAYEILEHREAELRAASENVVEMPKRTVEYTTPALDEAARAALQREMGYSPAPAAPPGTAEAKKRLEDELASARETGVHKIEVATDKQRYKRWKGLKESLALGGIIEEEDYSFYRNFGQTAICRAYAEMEEALSASK